MTELHRYILVNAIPAHRLYYLTIKHIISQRAVYLMTADEM